MTTAELDLLLDADNRTTSWAADLVAQETSLEEAQRIALEEQIEIERDDAWMGRNGWML